MRHRKFRRQPPGGLFGQVLSAALITAISATSARVEALPSDRQAPIEVESDRARVDEKSGVTRYEGNVLIVQGTMRINANQVTLVSVGGELSKIVCVGQPARYQQQPKAEDAVVKARAQTIEYLVDGDKIVLLKDAELVQEGATLRGERIDYDIEAELVEARGDGASNNRIRMVIPPSQQARKNPD